MRKSFLLFAAVAVSAGLLAVMCSKKSNPTGTGGGGGDNTQTLTYTVSGSTIIATFPESIDAYSYCNNGDTLVTVVDTSYSYVSSMPFSISGNTLTLIQDGDTATFLRSGTGSGLIGSWSADVTPGGWPTQLDVNATTIVATFSSCDADDFIDSWNSDSTYADSAYYNVTVTKISCAQVRLTGNVTSEHVTITISSAGDLTYTSSNTGHAAYTYYENPTTCPDYYEPSWYYSGFLDLNSKGTAKKAAKAIVPHAKKHKVRW